MSSNTSTTRPTGSNPIQLYSLGTPNGHKVSILLEELGLKYDAHTINITKNEQFQPWFLEISPNNRIPALVDQSHSPVVSVFESGAILIYLCEQYDKEGKFLPKSGRERYDVLQWLMWQMGGFGPMLGQMGHFHKYAPNNKELTEENLVYGKKRYLEEGQRLFKVLNKQLEGKQYICGDNYTIADIACIGWARAPKHFYNLADKFTEYTNVHQWIERIESRSAVQKGLLVNKIQ